MAITFNDTNLTLTMVYFIDDSEGTCTAVGDYNDAVDYFPDDAAIGDSVVFTTGGSGRGKYQGLNLDVGTALAADSISVVWEYAKRDGSGIAEWHALADVVDGTNTFQNTGINTVTWTIPEDWENYHIIYSGVSLYYKWMVRCRITALTNLTEGGKQAATYLTTKEYAISVSDYIEGTPATLQDIYDASVGGGWGVVEKSDQIYTFNCDLRIESGCYFETKQEIIQFKKNWDIYIVGVIKSGEVVTGDKCKNGSLFIFNITNCDLNGGRIAAANAEVYNTQYRYVITGTCHGHWGGGLGSETGQKIYDIYGEGLRQFSFAYDGNVIIGVKGFGMHIETPGAIVKNVTCYGTSNSVRSLSSSNTGDYMHECDFSGCTLSPINPYYVSNYDNQVMDFVDCNWGEFIDVEKMRWTNNTPTFYPDYYETYSMLLKVIDKDDNGISGVIVDLKDVNGAETFNYTTNADGYLGRESGVASSGTISTLIDSSKSWSSDEWWFQEVYITSGLGVGQRRIIKKGNTGTELQVAPDWDNAPDNTSKYVIIPYIRRMKFSPAALTPSSSVWSTVTDYSPFTLTLYAKGYRMHREKFVLDKKADWQIKLNRSSYTTSIK